MIKPRKGGGRAETLNLQGHGRLPNSPHDDPRALALGDNEQRKSSQTDAYCEAVDAGLSLCPEEQQIVALVMTGHGNKEIAHRFSLSERTIYRRIVRISRKLGVCNKLELVLLAISRQLCVGAQP